MLRPKRILIARYRSAKRHAIRVVFLIDLPHAAFEISQITRRREIVAVQRNVTASNHFSEKVGNACKHDVLLVV
jgi:hypothetical protein